MNDKSTADNLAKAFLLGKDFFSPPGHSRARALTDKVAISCHLRITPSYDLYITSQLSEQRVRISPRSRLQQL
jgi:hypothetical protein